MIETGLLNSSCLNRTDLPRALALAMSALLRLPLSGLGYRDAPRAPKICVALATVMAVLARNRFFDSTTTAPRD